MGVQIDRIIKPTTVEIHTGACKKSRAATEEPARPKSRKIDWGFGVSFPGSGSGDTKRQGVDLQGGTNPRTNVIGKIGDSERCRTEGAEGAVAF